MDFAPALAEIFLKQTLKISARVFLCQNENLILPALSHPGKSPQDQ